MNLVFSFVGLLALLYVDYGLGHEFANVPMLPRFPVKVPTMPKTENCKVTEEDPDADCIKGQAGKDYPNLSAIPKETAFACPGRGLYADIASKCQLFHICLQDGRKETFLCPKGTVFNQQLFTCDYWFNVDCSKSESFFSANKHLYTIPKVPNHHHHHQREQQQLPPQAPGHDGPEAQGPMYEAPEPQAPYYLPPTPEVHHTKPAQPKEKCLATEEDPDADCIQGISNQDYPNYQEVPKETAFICPNYGMYADIYYGCQIYHICHKDGRKHSFLCPKGSIFNQQHFTCEYWYNVDCSKAESFYHLNEQLYTAPKVNKQQAEPECEHPEAPEPQPPVYEAPEPQPPVYEAPEPQPPVYVAPKPQAPVYEAPEPHPPGYEAPEPQHPVYEAPKPQPPIYVVYPMRPSAPVREPAPVHPKEKCISTKEDPDADCIQGTAGKDYPNYHEVPKETAFVCSNHGIYADMSYGCQIYHVCHKDGRKHSFLCPKGSIFNQKHFTCEYWYNVDCSKSESFYALNDNLYKVPKGTKPPPQADPEVHHPEFPVIIHKPYAPVHTPSPVYKPKEKCLATKQDPDADCIQGTAGKDYPNYVEIPKETDFVCPNRGIYADVSYKCQMYHMCHEDGRKDSFLCPKGSIFNQKHFTCDYWYNVDCSKSESFFALNKDLYKVPPKQPADPAHCETPEPQAPTAPVYTKATPKPYVYPTTETPVYIKLTPKPYTYPTTDAPVYTKPTPKPYTYPTTDAPVYTKPTPKPYTYPTTDTPVYTKPTPKPYVYPTTEAPVYTKATPKPYVYPETTPKDKEEPQLGYF